MRTLVAVALICLCLTPAFCQDKPAPPVCPPEQTATASQYDVNVGVSDQTFQAMTKSVDAMAGLISRYVSGPLAVYYASMVKRQAALGWTGVGFCGVSLIFLCVCIGLIRLTCGADGNTEPGVLGVFWIIMGVVSLICFLIALGYLPVSISRIAAPESFAIQDIIKSLGAMKP